MNVDDAAALEDTLSRLRQRYALYFHMPEGAKEGEERSIEVDLADSARRRFADADVRYRRVYLASGGASSDVGRTQITRAPVSIPSESGRSAVSSRDDGPPVMRRRVAVDEPTGGPRVNMGGGDSSSADSSTVAAPSAAQPASQPSSQSQRGWRRVTDPSTPPASTPPASTPPASDKPPGG